METGRLDRDVLLKARTLRYSVAWMLNRGASRSTTMQIIQFLLPLHDNDNKEFPKNHFNRVRKDLTDRFGGVTAFVRSPAVGLWKEGNDEVNRDEVVMFEVMAEQLDKDWWAAYRKELEEQFRQDEVLIWAFTITKL